jgi:hypothetical protein
LQMTSLTDPPTHGAFERCQVRCSCKFEQSAANFH